MDKTFEGNIIVHEAEERYKKVTKAIIYDSDIDVIALGIFVRVISCSSEWHLNVKGLATALNLSQNKIRESLTLFEKKGYLRRTPVRDGKKFLGWNYEFFNMPIEEEQRTHAGTKSTDFAVMDFAVMDNTIDGQHHKCEHLNIETINKQETINKIENNKKLRIELEMEKLALPFQSDEFKEIWQKLCLLPKWKIKNASQLQFSLNKLAKMTEHDAIRSIEQTMECGYQGIFPPKPQSAYGNTPPPVAPTPSPEPPKRKKMTPWEEFGIPEDEWKEKHPHYSDYD